MAVGDGVVWNEALPDNSTLAHQIDDYNRDLRLGVRSRMAREHVWGSSQTGTDEGGHHRFITFQQQTGAPSLVAASGQVGAVYVGSSGAGYPLLFENSAGSAYTIINSAGRIQVVTSGTLGSIPICSSANPDGLTLLAGPTSTTATTYLLISSNNATGGVAAPIWATPATALSGVSAIGATNVSSVFGAWLSRSNNTSYQATSDGLVTAYTNERTNDYARMKGFTDASNPPTTMVACNESNTFESNNMAHVTFPVRKGDYWKVIGSEDSSDTPCTSVVYWIPLGV